MELKEIKKLKNLNIDINKIDVDPTHVIEHAMFEDLQASDYRTIRFLL